MESHSKDYYKILGVPKSASQSQIDKAYCKLSLRWHPSNNPNSSEEARCKYQEIGEAYSVLSDKVKRARYDKKHKKDSYDSDDDYLDSDKLFSIFFRNLHPFSEFNDDFFSDDFLGIKRKRPLELSEKSSKHDTESSNEEKRWDHSSEDHDDECIRHETSISSSTIIKNGERKTKTKKTMVGPDGKKKVKLIEEVEGKDGRVRRSVKCLEDGKVVKDQTKTLSAKGEKKAIGN